VLLLNDILFCHFQMCNSNVPKVVNHLINEIAEVHVMFERIEKQLGLGEDKRGVRKICVLLVLMHV